ncbi:MAG: AsmA family protein [Hyphomicrobium sp.]
MASQRPPGPPPHGRPPNAPPLATYRPGSEQRAGSGMPRKGPPPPMRAQGGEPPRRRRGGFLTGLLSFVFFLAIVAAAGVGYLLLNPPSDFIRTTLIDQVKAKTGRDLVIAGPTSFSVYPALGVSMKDVSLSAAPGMAGGPLVTIADLDISVKALPLLQRQIAVDRLILRKPVFDFRIDKSGKKSWDFAAMAPLVRVAQAAPAAPNAGGTATDAPQAGALPKMPTKISDLQNLALDDVRIEDGRVLYRDERVGVAQDVKGLNVKISLPSLTSPINTSGDVVWQGEKTDFKSQITNTRTIIDQKAAKLSFNASNRHLASTYDGQVAFADGLELNGQISAKAPSVKALAKWLGTDLPPVKGFGPMTLSGALKSSGNVTTLSNANVGLDGATATGTVSSTKGGVRPYVTANLKLSELDLNKYMTNAGSAASPAAPEPARSPATKPATPAQRGTEKPVDGIEELLQKPATKVYGYTGRAGWSSEPINLALLGVADVDAKLQVGRLLFQDIKVGQSALTVALKNKVMKTSFDEVQLYEGKGRGVLNVDGTGKAANIGANFALDGMSALPFLKDAADMEWLAGKARLNLQLAAQGGSQMQLVEALNGKADFAFSNGAIVGYNLAGAIRGLQQGKISGLKKAPTEKTDFSELSASFQITNGVAQNSDLKMTSPLLRVSGAGAVQMPPRTLDYTVKPKIVASLEGQQGAGNLAGLEIPVRISGPWQKPNIEPDIKGVLSDPNKAIEAVKDLSKKLKGRNAKEIVNELLGKSAGDSQTGTTAKDSTKEKAKELLKNLLKPQPQQ